VEYVLDICDKVNSESMKSVDCQVIRDYGTEVVIYTDGSATDGSKDGGTVVTTRGNPVSPDVICMEQKRGAACNSSFEGEKEAVSTAITWASSNCCKALISSDSQSLLRAIANADIC